jgi:hypothetical protein
MRSKPTSCRNSKQDLPLDIFDRLPKALPKIRYILAKQVAKDRIESAISYHHGDPGESGVTFSTKKQALRYLHWLRLRDDEPRWIIVRLLPDYVPTWLRHMHTDGIRFLLCNADVRRRHGRIYPILHFLVAAEDGNQDVR